LNLDAGGRTLRPLTAAAIDQIDGRSAVAKHDPASAWRRLAPFCEATHAGVDPAAMAGPVGHLCEAFEACLRDPKKRAGRKRRVN
jgi:hypothetical protein